MEPLKIPLLAIAIPLFVSLVPVTVDGQGHLCFTEDGNFTPNETYGKTLDALLRSITTTTSNTLMYGLFNESSSQPLYPDNIQVLGVCRGDATTQACRDCLNGTAHKVRRLCATMKQATLFEDMCWIRYSGSPMYGKVKLEPNVQLSTEPNVSNWDQFMVELRKLLDGLRNEAASGGPIRKYAAGNSTADFANLFGMAQCSPDLSQQHCSDCLVGITGRLPPGKVGGRVLAPSCQLRFETYPFFNSVAVALPSPPPPPPSPPRETTSPQLPPTQSRKTESSKTWIIIAVLSASAIIVIGILTFIVTEGRKSRGEHPRIEDEVIGDGVGSAESLQFNLDFVRAATENFSNDNKLGQGGFGPVFRGKLPNGQEIAVKRLLENSGQGEMEFKNEARLLARLQHRNLVKLLGFCSEGIEKLLIYEFVPNASLDKFIFDPLKRPLLDWATRYKIITGIARGLLYLHEDSRIRIIHRDLKAGNILLDADMNPKVSDFGMARLFEFDQTRADTRRIVGTYGYMAPEFVVRGHFSLKSDVFSFGVLVLEILSGRRNLAPHSEDSSEILLSHAWTNWREGRISNIIDPAVRSGYRANIVRCIHIGLLCVQENMTNRPTMASVVLMLNSQSVTLPVPTPPAFLMNLSSAGEDISPSVLDSTSKETKADCSANSTSTFSINEASITEPYPR